MTIKVEAKTPKKTKILKKKKLCRKYTVQKHAIKVYIYLIPIFLRNTMSAFKLVNHYSR